MSEVKYICLRQICFTCLSGNRKNFQLMKIEDGVNFLYNLLSRDCEVYREVFIKDVAQIYVCWECRAIIKKNINFKKQICEAQNRLTLLSSDWISTNSLGHSLSRLSIYHENSNNIQNFHDTDIYSENINTEPESFHIKYEIDTKREYTINNKKMRNFSENIQGIDESLKMELQVTLGNVTEKREFYTIIKACRKEIERRKTEKKLHLDNGIICDICVQKFKDNKSLKRHVDNTHTERKNYIHCRECDNYVKKSLYSEHYDDHKQYYKCEICNEIIFLRKLIKQHLQVVHKKRPAEFCVRKTPMVKNPGSKPRLYPALKDVETPRGFACPECKEYFPNKKLRYTHIQKCHRVGFKCEVCFKVFSFKNNFKKHQLLHTGSVQRDQCAECGKLIRSNCMNAHIQLHTQRTLKFECVPCDKRFISQATYDHHMKYTKAHATRDIYKYKCDHCSKGYRSKDEVRDHIHYTHMGKTQHACPICNKPIASKKSMLRHMKTWHGTTKNDNVKKEICQVCGKMFRLKKALREHIMIHTGERPLSCEICGNTFRQNASLYTHKKRVHKIFPKKTDISLIT